MNLAIRLGEFTKCQTLLDVEELINSFRGDYYTYIITKIQSRGKSHKLVPIYVGKGRWGRCLDHVKKGEKFEFEDELFYFLRPAKSEQFALDLETAIVAHFGRIVDGGTLFNVMKRGWKTTEGMDLHTFIEEANKVHESKYDYSNSNPIKGFSKLEIICKEHGSFWISGYRHLKGHGCQYCVVDKNLEAVLNSFTEKVKQVHGDKYDYSKVEYINAQTKVEIVCPDHGSFWQNPREHSYGHGCPDCAFNRKRVYNTKDFIKESIKVHGKNYDYSNTVYLTSVHPVTVFCEEHGNFLILPSSHLNGKGCPTCKGAALYVPKRVKASSYFIKEAREIHGDKFDYSKSVYIKAKIKLEIICPTHGSFWQTPNNHLRGMGCSDCAGTKKKTTEQFIEEAKQVHGNKYDYSNTEYIGARDNLEIICKKHGSFWKSPGNHIRKKQGCPKCPKKH